MALDQKTSAIGVEPEGAGSVIENELPTYRAISNLAVFSIICGGLSIFSWAHPFFYLVAVLAIVLGFLARRSIRQHPEMLTGDGLAAAGMTLGLIFGLASGTYSTVQYYVRSNLASTFAKHYAATVASAPLTDVLTLHVIPSARKESGGEAVKKQIDTATAKEKMMVEQRYGSLLNIRKRLESSKEEKIEFESIEDVGEDDSHGAQIPIYAFALFKIHGPGSTKFPDKEEHALAVLKGLLNGKQYEWWVEDIRYPYKPKSYVAPAKAPSDDGHNHAH